MDTDTITLVILSAIPISIVGFVYAFKTVKLWFEHTEKMRSVDGSQNPQLANAVEELRQQLAELRDTSTGFDVSLQRSLDNLNHRMSRVESGQQLPDAWSSASPSSDQGPIGAVETESVQQLGNTTT